MIDITLIAEIKEAILSKDNDKLRQLQAQLKRERWMNSFNGNIPVSAWLDNGMIRFAD
ncbi:hypothetical protein ADIARSV_0154 [Arcticibacter svalbardensis MN12-7]|uniref:Uncharacterized protein n=1 Tax=Arcticibacter svalbardensis MN12-7 TaxID=1150600 RepID=R9GYB5_9SPHI|nr:hypothetical protein [Arcticibacter svalbardensis]EOR96731.1 hypothetical protein ADIARSV_0154 [Arcticibacter svalbardensis MN12-7]